MEIRVIGAKERKRFDSLLGDYHYLGQTRPVGNAMRMVAQIDGEWVGLLMWGSAAYCLKPRDEFIGWTPTQRALRQKLVVQNRRFLLLRERGEHPNLASRILGAAIRELPRLWWESFGYELLLAETFTDIEPNIWNEPFRGVVQKYPYTECMKRGATVRWCSTSTLLSQATPRVTKPGR